MKKRFLFIFCGIMVAALLTFGVVALLNNEKSDNDIEDDIPAETTVCDYIPPQSEPVTEYSGIRDGTLVKEITESGKYNTPYAGLTAYPIDILKADIRCRHFIHTSTGVRATSFYGFNKGMPIESAKVISDDKILVTYKVIVSDRDVAAYLIFDKINVEYNNVKYEEWYLTDEFYFCDKKVSDNINKLTPGQKLTDDDMKIIGFDDVYMEINRFYKDKDGLSDPSIEEVDLDYIRKNCVDISEIGFLTDTGIIQIQISHENSGNSMNNVVYDMAEVQFNDNADRIEGYPLYDLESGEECPRVIFSCKDLIELP